LANKRGAPGGIISLQGGGIIQESLGAIIPLRCASIITLARSSRRPIGSINPKADHDLHPDLYPGPLQLLDMLYRGQRPEEDGKRHLFLNEDGDVFIGDEVADQIDPERPFCQCLRLLDQIAQDVGRIDIGADRAKPASFADRGRKSGTRDHRL
jgi:hypothetical protein